MYPTPDHFKQRRIAAGAEEDLLGKDARPVLVDVKATLVDLLGDVGGGGGSVGAVVQDDQDRVVESDGPVWHVSMRRRRFRSLKRALHEARATQLHRFCLQFHSRFAAIDFSGTVSRKALDRRQTEGAQTLLAPS